jgi:hypothetical protein
MMKIALGALRFFQLIFSAVVLGLSISLAKGQVVGSAPATTGYSGFCGAFGIIAAVIGIAAIFFEGVNGIITWIADGLAALVLLAGGIAMAIGLKGVDCGSLFSYYLNPIINCGTLDLGKDTGKGWSCLGDSVQDRQKNIAGRCRMARADDVMLFIAFAVSLGALAASFLFARKRLGSSNNYAI